MNVKLIAHTPDPEKVVAIAARVCYSNKADIETIAEGFTEEEIEKFIKQLKDSGHTTPFEHVSFTFAIEGISRACSHQLVRHRIASFSQRSQRYCTEDAYEFITPDDIANAPDDMFDIRDEYEAEVCNQIQEYKNLLEAGIPKESARYILPNAMPTRLIMTMNARSLLHFFNLRCCRRAQQEIRDLAYLMLDLVCEIAPNIFDGAGPSCVSLGYCPEGDRCCGRAPTLQKVMEGYQAYVRQQKSTKATRVPATLVVG